MRSLSSFHKSALAMGMLLVFAAVLPSQAMAKEAVSAAQSSASSSRDESVSDKTGDSWVTAKVKSELAGAKDVKSTDISVTTTEGVVALSGTVASTKQKNHVVHITKMVKGVKSVDASGLTVVPAKTSSSGHCESPRVSWRPVGLSHATAWAA